LGKGREPLRESRHYNLKKKPTNKVLAIMTTWSSLQKEYFEALCDSETFREASEGYVQLRLTTEVRGVTWKGQDFDLIRGRGAAEKGKWWVREALGVRDEAGRLRRERVVMLGKMGAGKSTACKRATWELAREGL